MRAYQGIFARFTLSSSASSASDFFFRPRPRNPILLLLNLSCFFWWLVFLLFLRRKIQPSLFAFFQADEKAEKAIIRRNFNAKIVSFEERGTKKQKEEKKRDKTRLSFLFSFFISLLGKKEYTHTQQQHKHARFREVKRER